MQEHVMRLGSNPKEKTRNEEAWFHIGIYCLDVRWSSYFWVTWTEFSIYIEISYCGFIQSSDYNIFIIYIIFRVVLIDMGRYRLCHLRITDPSSVLLLDFTTWMLHSYSTPIIIPFFRLKSTQQILLHACCPVKTQSQIYPNVISNSSVKHSA